MTPSSRQTLLLGSIAALFAAGVVGAAVHTEQEGDQNVASDSSDDRGFVPSSSTSATSTTTTTGSSFAAAPAGPDDSGNALSATGAGSAPAPATDTPGSGLAAGGNGSVARGIDPLAATGMPDLKTTALASFALALAAACRSVVRRAKPTRP